MLIDSRVYIDCEIDRIYTGEGWLVRNIDVAIFNSEVGVLSLSLFFWLLTTLRI